MPYSIKEIADKMKVTPSTIRYWDSEGLLPNIKRVSGIRVFEDKDFKWLRVLNCMKNMNMPIKKIKAYLELAQKGDSTLQERYEMILEQKHIIESQMNELRNCLKEFEYKEWYYKTAIEAGTEKVVENVTSIVPTLEIDRIPENYREEGHKNE
ncbi:MAG: MerR family transcriptional regulator [Anaeroplasmataceae bacterium]|nr:MerR family transcriptional regulator [Anaeroplasmataceae bacterium]